MRTSSIGRVFGQPGALDGGADRDAAQLGRRHAGQRAAELADRACARR